jgi:hypothetical protein
MHTNVNTCLEQELAVESANQKGHDLFKSKVYREAHIEISLPSSSSDPEILLPLRKVQISDLLALKGIERLEEGRNKQARYSPARGVLVRQKSILQGKIDLGFVKLT